VAPDQPLVGLFGAIAPVKGHSFFLDAAAQVAKRFPSARFAFVGASTDSWVKRGLVDDLNEQIRRLDLEPHMIRTGYLADATAYMRDFDVLTMPSVPTRVQFGEGFGLVMAESMAQGVATIATDFGAPREVIQHEVNGLLVPPRDVDALA